MFFAQGKKKSLRAYLFNALDLRLLILDDENHIFWSVSRLDFNKDKITTMYKGFHGISFCLGDKIICDVMSINIFRGYTYLFTRILIF